MCIRDRYQRRVHGERLAAGEKGKAPVESITNVMIFDAFANKIMMNRSIKPNDVLKAGLSKLRMVAELADIFKLPPLIFDVTLSHENLLYYSGFYFEFRAGEFVSKVDFNELTQSNHSYPVNDNCIVYGGRFDNLIAHYEIPDRESNKLFGCGLQMNMSKLTFILQHSMENLAAFSKEHLNNFSNDTEVYIISVGEQMLDHKLKLLSELWDRDLRADVMMNYTMAINPEEFKKRNVKLLVILKKSFMVQDEKERAVKIKDLERNTETEESIKNAADFIHKRLRGKASSTKVVERGELQQNK
eukprot:TRINITY_DN31380_c0_g1_i1.p1 TRINITY_DN31380_c0_g1~~TRINITY_DN31380_c0_g1_i1.p1  ORF type:complete len:301 (-),score=85.21 TRINITY_DN31380_c0_g1_i1:189-1091(-)